MLLEKIEIGRPKFNIFSNHPSEINNQYKKYLSNKLKKSFHLEKKQSIFCKVFNDIRISEGSVICILSIDIVHEELSVNV